MVLTMSNILIQKNVLSIFPTQSASPPNCPTALARHRLDQLLSPTAIHHAQSPRHIAQPPHHLAPLPSPSNPPSSPAA